MLIRNKGTFFISAEIAQICKLVQAHRIPPINYNISSRNNGFSLFCAALNCLARNWASVWRFQFLLRPNLRVISMNTNFCNNLNFWLMLISFFTKMHTLMMQSNWSKKLKYSAKNTIISRYEWLEEMIKSFILITI